MYLLNKLDHQLTLKYGYLRIGASCTSDKPLSEEDFKDPTVVDAISRGWAEKVTEKVEAGVKAGPDISIQNPKGGLTEAELKKVLADKVETPAAITTELGKDDGIPQGGAEGTELGKVESPAVETTAPAAKPAKAPKVQK